MTRPLIEGQVFGMTHPGARLCDDQVIAMREQNRAGASLGALAAQYGISKSQTARICRGRHWVHLLDDLTPEPPKAADPLPQLPRFKKRDRPGMRAFQLVAFALAALGAKKRAGEVPAQMFCKSPALPTPGGPLKEPQCKSTRSRTRRGT